MVPIFNNGNFKIHLGKEENNYEIK